MRKPIYMIMLALFLTYSCEKTESSNPNPKPDYKAVESLVKNEIINYMSAIENKTKNLSSYFSSTEVRDFGTIFPTDSSYSIDFYENTLSRSGDFSSGTVKYIVNYKFTDTDVTGGTSDGKLEIIFNCIGEDRTKPSSWSGFQSVEEII